MIGKLFLVVIVVSLILVGSVIAFNIPQFNSESKITEQLTASQVEKMIELGVIKVYVTLPENDMDKDTELIYQTKQGSCNIYQDIFGRYYCRW